VELVDQTVDLDERDVFLYSAGLDARTVLILDAAEPRGAAAVDRADVDVVADADAPHRHRPPQRPVPTHRRELELLRVADRFELVLRPGAHGLISTLTDSRSLIAR